MNSTVQRNSGLVSPYRLNVSQSMGWQPDPFGRHAVRFFDATMWTAFVRDGDANNLDEPGSRDDDWVRPPAGLMTEDLLVVERRTVRGLRWSDRAILGRDGSPTGQLRRAGTGKLRSYEALRDLAIRDHTNADIVELVDTAQQVAMILVRPIGVGRRSIEVRDGEGRDVGRLVEEPTQGNAARYVFLAANGGPLGELRPSETDAWDLSLLDNHGAQLATISRDFSGLAAGLFDLEEDYVLRIGELAHQPLRTLAIAAALSLDIVVRPATKAT